MKLALIYPPIYALRAAEHLVLSIVTIVIGLTFAGWSRETTSSGGIGGNHLRNHLRNYLRKYLRNTAKALTPIRKEYTLFFIVVINDLEFLRPLEVAYIYSGFIND